MTAQKVYWIADPEGVKACVNGAEARDFWVKVRGYAETSEPIGLEFQWVRNENHGGFGVLNHAAVLLLGGLGWHPSGPPPVPGMPDDTETEPAAVPAITTAPAVGGTGREFS